MIRRVEQLHDNGCFISAVAMLLGITYQEAFTRIYPNRIMPPPGAYDPTIGMMFDDFMAMIPRIGIELKFSGLRYARSLKKRTSLVILRWHDVPSLSHTLVFDGERGIFVDPCWKIPPNYKIIQRNLLAIYYAKRVQPYELPIRNIDTIGSENTGRLSEPSSLPGSSTSTGTAYW